jgi:hypothetical protein
LVIKSTSPSISHQDYDFRLKAGGFIVAKGARAGSQIHYAILIVSSESGFY